MKHRLLTFILFCYTYSLYAQEVPIEKAFKIAEHQTDLLLQETKQLRRQNNGAAFPRTFENGHLQLVKSSDWTSGFFPGTLWLLYAHSGDEKWLKAAQEYTALLKEEQFNTRTHDLGFMIYSSFGNGYRLTGNKQYHQAIIQAAKSLSTRFDPNIGLIRSWDHNQDKWQYPVIIDNMLNLELLFAATKLTQDSSFYKIAIAHADKTLLNHFRADYSTFHVVDYTPTGEVKAKATHQGYNDESAWARGQAWALYGYTMCYRETHNKRYLEQAEKVANFILSHKNLPADLVPYWDFDDPNIPNVPRDASAAAIIASALYELSTYSEKNTYYVQTADNIMKSLTDNYTSKARENRGFILTHSTGNKPKNSEVDVPLNYADYYFIEALLRRQNINKL